MLSAVMFSSMAALWKQKRSDGIIRIKEKMIIETKMADMRDGSPT